MDGDRGVYRERQITALFVIGAFLVVLALSMLVGDAGPAEPEPDEPTPRQAAVMCQQFVRENLRAPRTAKFPRVDEVAVTDRCRWGYRVTSHVDAQNAFGALLRSNYTCDVEYLGNEKWRLNALEFQEP